MSEVNFEGIAEICPAANDSCVKKCPVLSMHYQSIQVLTNTYDQVVTGATSEEVDSFAVEILSKLPTSLRKQFGFESPEDIATQHRKGSSMILEQIDQERESEADSIREVSYACDGPLELTGDDSTGRFMGVFICRSPFAPEGKALEAATVYRYLRQ